MADKIDLKKSFDYYKDVIIRESDDKPRKILILHLKGGNSILLGPTMWVTYRVVDSTGRIRYSGDHFNQAVEAYNKLYNE